MSFFTSYTVFSVVILLSLVVVAMGTVRLRRLEGMARLAVVAAWLGVHMAAVLSGTGGSTWSNLLVLGTATGVGTLLARAVREPGALIAMALTASVVDVVSFSSGPTRWLLDSGAADVSEALRYLVVSFPLDGALVPVVGVGDLLLFGTFFLALRDQGQRTWVVATVLAAGLLVALAVGLLRGGAFGIPFMAVGAVALTLVARHRRSRGEFAP